MSEQDKRAEEVWDQAHIAYGVLETMKEKRRRAIAPISRALAQARREGKREGVEAAVADAEAFVQHCREEGETDLRSILYHLRGIAAALEEGGSR